MNSRLMAVEDKESLQEAMDKNTWHPGQKAESYMVKGVTFVYGDKPVTFLNYEKILRVRVQWCDEQNRAQNKEALTQMVEDAVKLARDNDYGEIIFQTDNPALAKAAMRLGFEESRGEYRREVNYVL
jgi:hypothetical protein